MFKKPKARVTSKPNLIYKPAVYRKKINKWDKDVVLKDKWPVYAKLFVSECSKIAFVDIWSVNTAGLKQMFQRLCQSS